MRFGASITLGVAVILEILYAQINWTEHTINGNFDVASSVQAIDMNGDSDIDVLGASIGASRITYWENDGNVPVGWTEYDITDDADGGWCYVYAHDMDSDTDIDVLGAAWFGNEIAWWESDGNAPPAWTKHSIDGTFTNAHEVYAIDMDNDSDIDVLGASAELDQIAWWENSGITPLTWTKHIIAGNVDGARSVYANDINGDGLVDVLGAALLSNDVTLWLNNGDSTWTEQTIDGSFGGAHKVYACDIDGDDDIDILGAAYNPGMIAWWEHGGDNPITWTKHIVDASFPGALTAYAADIDGRNGVDIIGAANNADDIAWYENDGTQNFTKHIIDGAFDGAWPVCAADIDNDTDIDVIGGADTADDITWWENSAVGIDETHSTAARNRIQGATILHSPLQLDSEHRHIVYDIDGRRIDATQCTPGIYFIEIDGARVQKIILVR